MNMAMAPIRIWVMWAEKSADFSLMLTTCNKKGEPTGQLSTIKVGDENINERLRDVIQAVRMGMRIKDEIDVQSE